MFAFLFRFILLAPAHTVSLQPLQPMLYYIDPSFSLPFCLDPHVFNVNATKNHDPFLLIWFSFPIFRSLSRPAFFFRVTGFRQIPSSFYWRWREIPHLNFLPLYHYDEPSFSGRIWAYSHLGCRFCFLGFLINMIVGRGSAARNRNRNRNKNRYLSGMSYTGGCLNLFLLWLFSFRRRILVHITDALCIYGLGILNFVTCDLVPRSKAHIHYSSIPGSSQSPISPFTTNRHNLQVHNLQPPKTMTSIRRSAPIDPMQGPQVSLRRSARCNRLAPISFQHIRTRDIIQSGGISRR